jgi:16S rRNA C1402 N4-methylase RsmH
MRFDPTTGQPVSQYLHQVHVQDLSTKLQNYGDFSDARAAHIARHITRSQQSAHIKTTQQLVQVLYDIGLGGRQQAVVFQVLRIIVNDELGHLKRFLETFQDHLTIG